MSPVPDMSALDWYKDALIRDGVKCPKAIVYCRYDIYESLQLMPTFSLYKRLVTTDPELSHTN